MADPETWYGQVRDRRSFVQLRFAVSALALLIGGCSGDAGRSSPPQHQALQQITLPDISRTSPSVQQQIQEGYAALARQVEKQGTPAAELANAFGEMGKLLMAAEFGQAAEPCLLNAQAL